ncbi:MAG: GNAT family N-acetyltransferase [Anaerolineae bacterium]|nr:GNAT family N-acetyltransferase [Anaerolineae bacterium]
MFKLQVSEHVTLELLATKHAEAQAVIVAENRAFIGAWLPWAWQSTELDHARQFIAMMRKLLASGSDVGVAIMYEGALVGGLGLHIREAYDACAEIGYWLAENQNGKGIMTQSAKVLTDYGFGALGLNRIFIRAAAENQPSQNVAKRLGFQYEMTARKGGFLSNDANEDRPIDMQFYAMLKEDWHLPKTIPEFAYSIGDDLELRLMMHHHDEIFYEVVNTDRSHLRETQPWVDDIQSTQDARYWIEISLEKYVDEKGFSAGIWQEGWLVGVLRYDIDRRAKSVNLSYWSVADTDPEVIVRAVRAAANYAFSEDDLVRVEIACPPYETQRHIPETVGFTLEGIKRQTHRIHGHFVDSLVYAMLADDWHHSGDET